MWSILIVYLFILKSRLGTTASLVEYFSRRYSEEGKMINQKLTILQALSEKRPVCE